MTENENIQATLEDAIYCAKSWSGEEVCEECRFYPLCHTFCDDVSEIIVQALSEIQQYRAIGTVKGCEDAIQSSIENYNLYRECKAKLQEYEKIGTVEEFKVLKEKKPKKEKSNKVIFSHDSYAYCPHCKGSIEEGFMNPRVCGKCGGELDWH